MKSFSSQIGTKNAPGELKPFGWTRETVYFRDSIADFEHDRAQMEGRRFGRRDPSQPLERNVRATHRLARKNARADYALPKTAPLTIRHSTLLLRK